jgi:membrane protein DedA with SNARE-associated domain
MDTLLEHFGYLAMFAMLVGGGAGLPLPEEAIEIGAGVLAHQGVLDVRKVMIVAWVGVLAGDSIIYSIGRRHGERVLELGFARRVLTTARRERLRHHFERHAFLTVFVARHLGGLRSAVFALAGAHGVRYRTMLLADALSALVSVPVAAGLGYLFSRQVLQVEHDMRVVQGTILAVAAVAAALTWLRVRQPAALGVMERRGATAATARRVLIAFLTTFIAARTIVYLIMSRRIPNITVHSHGMHVHHLDYGIFLLALVGATLLFWPGNDRLRRGATTVYGIALALTFDEFGMWLHLGGDYWQRASFDAVVAIAAMLGLVAAAPSISAFRPRHWAVTAAIALGIVVFGYVLVDAARFADDRWLPSLQALDVDPPP